MRISDWSSDVCSSDLRVDASVIDAEAGPVDGSGVACASALAPHIAAINKRPLRLPPITFNLEQLITFSPKISSFTLATESLTEVSGNGTAAWPILMSAFAQ